MTTSLSVFTLDSHPTWLSLSFLGQLSMTGSLRKANANVTVSEVSISFQNFRKCSLSLHHHMDMLSLSYLREIDWVPTVEQVNGTLPHSFRKLYPKTYAKCSQIPSTCSCQCGVTTWTPQYLQVSCGMYTKWCYFIPVSRICGFHVRCRPYPWIWLIKNNRR